MNELRRLLLLLLVVSCPAIATAVDDEPAPELADKPVKQTKITIAADTTYLLEPLNEEGYVDYLAALNQSASKDVTPANNFVVPLCEVVGPGEILDGHRKQFFAMLGMPAPAVDGDYFTAYDVAIESLADGDAEERERLLTLFGNASEEPWSPMNSPEVAAWLDRQEKHLDKIVAASQREKFYAPMISDDGMVISALIPLLSPLRSIARGLKIRAMGHIQRGKFAAAWDDLQATHRIGRLAGQSPTLIDALVAIAVDGMGAQGDRVFLQHAKLDSAGWRSHHNQLQELSPLPTIADVLNTSERYAYLDACQMVSRDGVGAIRGLAGGGPDRDGLKLFEKAIDWNETMRFGNSYYDRMVTAMRMQDTAAAMQALEKVNEDLQQQAKKLRGIQGALEAIFTTAKDRGKMMGGLLCALMLPAAGSCYKAELRSDAFHDATELAFALRGYHAEHGEYPENLDALKPKFMTTVPVDRLSGKSFHYERQGQGCVLYGVGQDEIDGGGDAEQDDVIRLND